jgi:hypothetical protein
MAIRPFTKFVSADVTELLFCGMNAGASTCAFTTHWLERSLLIGMSSPISIFPCMPEFTSKYVHILSSIINKKVCTLVRLFTITGQVEGVIEQNL